MAAFDYTLLELPSGPSATMATVDGAIAEVVRRAATCGRKGRAAAFEIVPVPRVRQPGEVPPRYSGFELPSDARVGEVLAKLLPTELALDPHVAVRVELHGVRAWAS